MFNIPHSGSVYPASLLLASHLDALTLRRSEDAFVDELFGGAPDLGALMMRAVFPRVFVDVNREPYEFDPRLLSGPIPGFANTRSTRVMGGLGTIPRIVADGQNIYPAKIALDEALRRVETLYKPYHRMLRKRLSQIHAKHGHAVLIDGHSMPSGSDGVSKVDIVLGDRYGSSCIPALTQIMEKALRGIGLRCVRNKPYAGGFITEYYGEPGTGRHALQIEINRALYMDEKRFERNEHFDTLRQQLTLAIQSCIIEMEDVLQPPAMAAE